MLKGSFMRRLITNTFFTFALLLGMSTAFAEVKIAVVNSQMALLESEPAKVYAERTESKFSAQLKRLKNLQDDFEKLSEKYDKDALTLSESERNKIQLEMRRKKEDWELQANQLRAERNELDQKEFEKLQPLLIQAVEQVAKSDKYDMVLERASVRFVTSDHDITRKVIDALNKLAEGKK